MDAQLLAALGESQHPQPTPPPNEAQEGLKALRRHLEWLEREIRGTKNRLEAARRSPWTPPEVTESLERTLRRLEAEAQQVEQGLRAKAHQEEDVAHQIRLLTSM